MAGISTYDDLVAAIGSWLDRDDLSDKIPTFIQLAEARLKRLLSMPDMETTVTLTAAASVPLPADFNSVRSLYLTTTPRQLVTPVAPADFYGRPFDTPGLPTIYAIVDGNLVFSPAPDASTPAVMTYLATIPSLGTSQETNWLLTKYPDIYLYASLVQAEFYGWNDDRLTLIKGALDEAIAEANSDGNRQRYSGAPLVKRPPVHEAVRGAYRR